MANVKIRKRKLNIKRTLVIFLVLIITIFTIKIVLEVPLNNIYVEGNVFYTDNDIIELTGISLEDSIVTLSTNNIEDLLLENPYVEKIVVNKSIWSRSVTINVWEKSELFIYTTNDTIILNDGTEVINNNENLEIPTIINYVPNTILEKLVKGFEDIEGEVLTKISEIKYDPVEVDEKRFLISMRDGNYVYINTSKLISLNNYNEILIRLENKKGILYLDSGEYFEIIEEEEE